MFIGAYMYLEQLSTVQTGRLRVMGDLMVQDFGFIKISIDHFDHTYIWYFCDFDVEVMWGKAFLLIFMVL